MELKLVDCPSNKINFLGDDLHNFQGFLRWDENTLIVNTRGSMIIWDISNPLDLKKICSLDIVHRECGGLLRVGNLLYIYPKGFSYLSKLSYSIADLSDIKNGKVIAIHPIDPKNTEGKSLLSMRMTSDGSLLAIIDDRGLVQIADDGELTLIDKVDSEIGMTKPPADFVLLGNLLVVVGTCAGVFLFHYNDKKPVLLKEIKGVPSATPPPINLVLDNSYIVLTDSDNIQMIDIRDPKKAKRLPKLKIPGKNFVREDFLVETDTMLTVKIAEKKDICSLLTVRLLSEGPVLYEETPVDITAWPRKYDKYDTPLALFKKDKHLLFFSSSHELGVFEMIK